MRSTKLEEFSIHYDSPQKVYTSGSPLGGTVMVHLRQAMSMLAIKVLVHGGAKVKWNPAKDENTCYSASRTYLDNNIILLQLAQDAGSEPRLSPGVHMYNFTVYIPQDAPSSLQFKYGYIRYYCEATIERSQATMSGDISINVPFTVIRPLDLNMEPEAFKQPADGRDASDISCLCCCSGNVSAYFKVYKRAFVPGEPIVVYAKVANNSNAVLDWSMVKLIQDSEFYGTSNSLMSSGNLKPKSRSEEVVNLSHGRILPNSTYMWDNEKLYVPALPPSNIEGCDIINISYVVQFSVHVPYGHNLELGTTIVIGTVPLVPTPQRSSPVVTQPGSVALPELTCEQAAATSSAPALELMPPPSYEECVSGKVQIIAGAKPEDHEDYDAEENFVPRYAYYNWSRVTEALRSQELPGVHQ